MQKLFYDVYAGADKPMDEAAVKLPKRAGDIASGILKATQQMTEMDYDVYLKERVNAANLTGRNRSTMAIQDYMDQQRRTQIFNNQREQVNDSRISQTFGDTIIHLHGDAIKNEDNAREMARELERQRRNRLRGQGVALA
jgi:hypothetical protein